jgi:hypothetical protein
MLRLVVAARWVAVAAAFVVCGALVLNANLRWGWLGRFADYAGLLSLLPVAAAMRYVVGPALDRSGVRGLSYDRKRAALVVPAAVFLVCQANVLLSWHLFGRLDKPAAALSVVLVTAFLHYVGPTVEEIREFQRARAARRS